MPALSKTELLTSVPPRGCMEGENGYFLATPAVVEYFDYWVGQTFRYEQLSYASRFLHQRSIRLAQRCWPLQSPRIISEWLKIDFKHWPTSDNFPLVVFRYISISFADALVVGKLIDIRTHT